MKFIIYARVSPKGSGWDSEETSIPMQIDLCRRYVDAAGGTVVDVLQDEFFSAKDTNRPGMQRILADLRGDRGGWDAIVVYRLDRLTRSVADGAPLLELLRDSNRGLASVVEHLDMASPFGRCFMNMLLAWAQLEREQTALRVKDKMTAMSKRGLCMTRAPFGYRRDEAHGNVLQVEPREAEIVRDCFRRYIGGESVDRLVARHGLNKTTVLYLLRNVKYTGANVIDEQEYPGQWEPLLSRTDFDKAQARLPKRRDAARPAAQKHEHLLSGMIRCACGRHMTCTSNRGRSQHYAYYECKKQAGGCGLRVSAAKLEGEVLGVVKQAPFEQEHIDYMLGVLRDEAKANGAAAQPELEQVSAALRTAEKQQARLVELLMDPAFADNKPLFSEKLAETTKELSRLRERKSALAAIAAAPSTYGNAEAIIHQLRNIADALAATDSAETRRSAIVATINRIEITKAKAGAPAPYGVRVYPNFAGAAKEVEWWAILDSNQ